MATSNAPDSPAFDQSIAGCLTAAIGPHGLTDAELARWYSRLDPELARLKADHQARRLDLLRLPGTLRALCWQTDVALCAWPSSTRDNAS